MRRSDLFWAGLMFWFAMLLLTVSGAGCTLVAKRERTAYARGHAAGVSEARSRAVDVASPADPEFRGGFVEVVVPAWATCTSGVPPICSYYDSAGGLLK